MRGWEAHTLNVLITGRFLFLDPPRLCCAPRECVLREADFASAMVAGALTRGEGAADEAAPRYPRNDMLCVGSGLLLWVGVEER